MAVARYIPILKSKAGEFQALGDLADDVAASLTPLFEIIPVSEFADSSKTTDGLIKGLPERLEKSWGKARVLFLDGFMVEEDTMEDGTEPIAALMDGCRERGVQAIPVTGLHRVSEYQQAVADAVESDGLGACLRLTAEDLADAADMEAEVSGALDSIGCNADLVHLLVDYGPITEEIRSAVQVGVVAQLAEIPFVDEWASLTLAASAFPQDLSALARGGLSMIPRSEWSIWKHVYSKRGKLPRLPSFGDYGIAHPNLSDVDPRIMRMSPNIRYAHDDCWIIAKGHALSRKSDSKKNPPSREQYPALSRAIVESEYWRGTEFSRGDAFIAECAEGSAGPGNATSWRRVGTDHHLTSVVRQLSSLRAL